MLVWWRHRRRKSNTEWEPNRTDEQYSLLLLLTVSFTQYPFLIFFTKTSLYWYYYYKNKKQKKNKKHKKKKTQNTKHKMAPFYARFSYFPKYKFTLFSLISLNSLSLSLSSAWRLTSELSPLGLAGLCSSNRCSQSLAHRGLAANHW